MSKKILFGTAGVPNSTAKKNSPIEGVRRIHELGLDCMQLEFAHGVRMKEEVSSGLRKVSYELGVPLTSHGPYYINLNAREQDKMSTKGILNNICSTVNITIVSAYYRQKSIQPL